MSLCQEIIARSGRNTLNIGSLPGDIFTNNVINGAVELVAYILCGAFLDRLGRRLLLGKAYHRALFIHMRPYDGRTMTYLWVSQY